MDPPRGAGRGRGVTTWKRRSPWGVAAADLRGGWCAVGLVRVLDPFDVSVRDSSLGSVSMVGLKKRG